MRKKFYPEEVLIEKMENGEFDWLDYVNYHSQEWQDEFAEYCEQRNLPITSDSAEAFVRYKENELEEAMCEGEA